MPLLGERKAPHGGALANRILEGVAMDSDRLIISGAQARQMQERNGMQPVEFTRPEVSRVLVAGLRVWAEARA